MTEPTTTDMTRGVYRRVYSGFVTSKRFSALSLEASDTFWRLNAIADDYGNLFGEPVLVRSHAMPYRNWTDAKIMAVLKELVDAGLIYTYPISEEVYIHIVDFEERQPAGRNGKRIQRHPMHPGESGGIRGNPDASKGIQCSDTDTDTDTETTTDSFPQTAFAFEAKKQQAATVGEITWTAAGGFSGITDYDRANWRKAYPACNIDRQLAAAHEWLLSNPSKAVKRQWRRFVTNWLSRSQERGGDDRASPAGGNPPPRRAMTEEDAKAKGIPIDPI